MADVNAQEEAVETGSTVNAFADYLFGEDDSETGSEEHQTPEDGESVEGAETEPVADQADPETEPDAEAQADAPEENEGGAETVDDLDKEIAEMKKLGGGWISALGQKFPIPHKGSVRELTATELHRFSSMGIDYNKKMEASNARESALTAHEQTLHQAQAFQSLAQQYPLFGQIATVAMQEFGGMIPPGSIMAVLEQSGYTQAVRPDSARQHAGDPTEDEIAADPKAAMERVRQKAMQDAKVEFQKYMDPLMRQGMQQRQGAEQIQQAAFEQATRAAVSVAFAEAKSEKGFALDQDTAAQYLQEAGLKYDQSKATDKDYWKGIIRGMNQRYVKDSATASKATERILKKELAAKQQKSLAKGTVPRKGSPAPAGGFSIGPKGGGGGASAFADHLFGK